MDVEDERELLRKMRRQRGDNDEYHGEESKQEFLKRNFEDPEKSDILMEKQVKERKRKR